MNAPSRRSAATSRPGNDAKSSTELSHAEHGKQKNKNTPGVHPLSTADSPLFDLVLRQATLVDSRGPRLSDLAISGQHIAAVGPDLHGSREIDARGLLLLPGAVDPHVHLAMPVGATCSSDDWFTGTQAAALGGTTTVIDFVEPQPGESLAHALAARRDLAQRQAAVDFGLHVTLANDDPHTLAEIPQIVAAGCPSFKTYLTYEGFRLGDSAFLNVLEAVSSAGGIVLVHAENDAMIVFLHRRFRRQGHTAPRFHALSRPPVAEAEAIQRSLALAEVTGARIYLVHVSTARGVEALASARSRRLPAFGETCPQYLLLTAAELDRPGFEGAKFVCSPPLRSAEDNQRLWEGLAAGDIQSVGTDHCPFFFQGQKDLGLEDYEKIPGGLPGIESRMALLYHYGVRAGRLSLARWVEVCSTNPARIMGLYPRKGSLEPGSDADLVLFDPHKKIVLSTSTLHERVDYTPYEGFELEGWPVLTLLHGQVIVENGSFTGNAGQGAFLCRALCA